MGGTHFFFGAICYIFVATGLGASVLPQQLHHNRQLQTRFSAEGTFSNCFPALFSFGSSVADTGTIATVWPVDRSDLPPYGSTFFGKPAGRYSDGRLHIDYWASALGIPFLDPYLRSTRADFRRGVNFAAAGATAADYSSFSPFYLSRQHLQFQEFKQDVLANVSGTASNALKFENLPDEKAFKEGIYVIAIGGNDVTNLLLAEKLSLQQAALQIPKSSESILGVVEALYQEGARNILIENVHPLGCMPFMLTAFAQEYSNQLDAAGCIKPINDLVQLHNSLLLQGVKDLREKLQNASISVIDTYSKRYEVIANYEHYGFQVSIKACCGVGGNYDYRPDIPCGTSLNVGGQVITAAACGNISSHIIWDGVHFTDAFNHVVMNSILSGNYFDPPFNLRRGRYSLAFQS